MLSDLPKKKENDSPHVWTVFQISIILKSPSEQRPLQNNWERTSAVFLLFITAAHRQVSRNECRLCKLAASV